MQNLNPYESILKNEEIDLVIANTVKTAPLLLFARELGIPSISIIRESYSPGDRFSYFKKNVESCAIKGLQNADLVIFVSKQSEIAWMDFCEQIENILIINNGIDVSRFKSCKHTSKIFSRKKLGIADDLFVCLCVGTIGSRKNQIELIDWIETIPKEIIERMLFLFVGAREGTGLQNFYQRLGNIGEKHQKHIKVADKTNDIGLYYNAADLFLTNSKVESYPRSVMEALLFGLPVISTPCYGIKEQIRHGYNGFLYDFGDMKAWCDHIFQLFDDKQVLANMTKQAKTSFWELTTYSDMLHQYYCAVRKVLSNSCKIHEQKSV